eukprot:98131-Ditylum_brightwellii.AAC.1
MQAKKTKERSAACESYSKRGGKCKTKCKASKEAYRDWDQESPQYHSDGKGCHYYKYHGHCNHTMEECRITINQHKGCTYHQREDRSCKNKKVSFSSGKAKSHEASSDENKDLHAIIDEKIAATLERKEKKDLNKFEALSILLNSYKDNGSDSDSRVSDTSNEGLVPCDSVAIRVLHITFGPIFDVYHFPFRHTTHHMSK